MASSVISEVLGSVLFVIPKEASEQETGLFSFISEQPNLFD
jgi:hypothetical protein